MQLDFGMSETKVELGSRKGRWMQNCHCASVCRYCRRTRILHQHMDVALPLDLGVLEPAAELGSRTQITGVR
ncbi:hypothetical protein I79_022144 [Cricetulus griseus]|uniref:Uncharacterized protein n=1 Tax=Cricetulus griseus TaxID=10029 RepID=G3IEJ7_CRIGR|nr:hypothetical protein I79_022144 [Cricetulus griseus]